MQGGAARDEDDPVYGAQLGRGQVQTAQMRRGLREMDAAAHGVLHGLRLLENLLEHEMRELTALDFFCPKLDLMNLWADFRGIYGGNLEVFFHQSHDFEIVEVHDPPRVNDDRACIAGKEILAAADTDQQGAAAPRPDKSSWMFRVNDCDAVSSYHILERAPHGMSQEISITDTPRIPVFEVVLADQMRQDLGVGLRQKTVPPGKKFLLELLVILDHAVVDERDGSGLVEVRVRILVARRAVGGPTGVPDPGGALGRLLTHQDRKFVDPAHLLSHLKPPPVVDDADARGVVSSIFQSP